MKIQLHNFLNIIFLSVLLLSLTCCTIDEKGDRFDNETLIAEEGDSYSYKDRTGDLNNLEFSLFSGTDTVYHFQEGDSFIEINYQVISGRFKVVMIDDENKIIILEPGLHMITRGARIKLVGDNATGNIQIIITT